MRDSNASNCLTMYLNPWLEARLHTVQCNTHSKYLLRDSDFNGPLALYAPILFSWKRKD